MPKPSVGRIVHFIEVSDALAGSPLAAIVLGVAAAGTPNPERLLEHCFALTLRVLRPQGDYDILAAPFSARYAPGCWSWPPIERGE